ncbi:MAG: histidine phosphatase family protein [Anaerolineae bacterium]|nr:histidine phosphatase family protein [Anaerolineae bacterium]
MNHLFLVRHGENLANLTKEFSSRWVDYSLTAKGVLQAEQTAVHFLEAAEAGRADYNIHTVYSSPLKRAKETAEIIARYLGLPVVVMDNFREIDVGDMELQPSTIEAWALHNHIIESWFRGQVERAFPNGDNYITIRDRMRAGIEQIFAGKDNHNSIVVGHGGIFTVTLPDLCPNVGLGYLRAENHNCSISEIEVEWRDGRLEGRLLAWATYAHLYGPAADLVSGLPDMERR